MARFSNVPATHTIGHCMSCFAMCLVDFIHIVLSFMCQLPETQSSTVPKTEDIYTSVHKLQPQRTMAQQCTKSAWYLCSPSLLDVLNFLKKRVLFFFRFLAQRVSQRVWPPASSTSSSTGVPRNGHDAVEEDGYSYGLELSSMDKLYPHYRSFIHIDSNPY